MALDTTKTLTGVKYNGVAFPLDDGQDMLQARVDGDNSCAYLFYEYRGAELDVSRLDTSNVTDMKYMFYDCINLTMLDLNHFDTSSVITMGYMFYNCTNLASLDLSNFNTSNVTRMNYMFYSCQTLQTLDLSSFNTSNVIYMDSMFQTCGNLTSLDLSNFNTSKVTGMYFMFYYCGKLLTIQGILDLYSAINVTNMFYRTSSLTGVTLKNIRTSLQIGSGTSWGHKWELSYLINAVKELWDLSSGSQQTLTIGSANLEKIANTYVKLITPTAEQIEADPYINNKLPCVECESTDEGAMTLTAYAGLKNWVLA